MKGFSLTVHDDDANVRWSFAELSRDMWQTQPETGAICHSSGEKIHEVHIASVRSGEQSDKQSFVEENGS